MSDDARRAIEPLFGTTVCIVEIIDDRGGLMLSARGKLMAAGPLRAIARVAGEALTEGSPATVSVSLESGEFIGGGPAAEILDGPLPKIRKGAWLHLDIKIGPGKVQP